MLEAVLPDGKGWKKAPKTSPGIYAIFHPPSRTVYVGRSANVSMRWSRHRHDMRTQSLMQSHSHSHIHPMAYFWPDVKFYALEYTFDIVAREKFWITFFRDLGCKIVNKRTG